MLSKEMAPGVTNIADDVQQERWSPIVNSPEFAFPGLQCFSSHASASLTCTWGFHEFGTIACGNWTQSTQDLIKSWRISINPHELLASAAAIKLLDNSGMNDGWCKVVLRGKKTTAFLAANTGVAYSPSMRFSLRLFVHTCREANVRCWMIHPGMKENRISDVASRQEVSKATEAIRAA